MKSWTLRRRSMLAAFTTAGLLASSAVAYSATVPNPDPRDSNWSAL